MYIRHHQRRKCITLQIHGKKSVIYLFLSNYFDPICSQIRVMLKLNMSNTTEIYFEALNSKFLMSRTFSLYLTKYQKFVQQRDPSVYKSVIFEAL